jgi:hypothetical protein
MGEVINGSGMVLDGSKKVITIHAFGMSIMDF